VLVGPDGAGIRAGVVREGVFRDGASRNSRRGGWVHGQQPCIARTQAEWACL
jgi:hypothetical protein